MYSKLEKELAQEKLLLTGQGSSCSRNFGAHGATSSSMVEQDMAESNIALRRIALSWKGNCAPGAVTASWPIDVEGVLLPTRKSASLKAQQQFYLIIFFFFVNFYY